MGDIRCENCNNCLPIGDGDAVCNAYLAFEPSRLVIERDEPADDYFWCGGSAWEGETDD